jgi:hypothetical protein
VPHHCYACLPKVKVFNSRTAGFWRVIAESAFGLQSVDQSMTHRDAGRRRHTHITLWQVPTGLETLHHLRELIIDGNYITSVPPSLLQLRRLSLLVLSYNSLVCANSMLPPQLASSYCRFTRPRYPRASGAPFPNSPTSRFTTTKSLRLGTSPPSTREGGQCQPAAHRTQERLLRPEPTARGAVPALQQN